MKKLSRFQKILILSGAALLLVLACIFFAPGPDPYVNISNDQWVQMCREAYDSLHRAQYLHFTLNTSNTTPNQSTTFSRDIWFSGDNFFLRETREDGNLRASLLKDGTYYRNQQNDLAPSQWRVSTGSPEFLRSDSAWNEDYALDRFARNRKQLEIIFTRDSSLPQADGLRIHQLAFRFNEDLKVTAIIYTFTVYSSGQADPNNIQIHRTDEYIFHATSLSDIEDAIEEPLRVMAAHQAEAEKWTAIAAAVYEELCSRTFLHYTYTTTRQDEEHAPGYTAQCEGWYSGTDSVTDETRIGQITRTYIRIQKGSVYCKKTIRSEEDSGWDVEEREPSMHGRYQHKWPEDTYTFYSAEAVDTGMDLTFWRVTSPPHHDNQIPGITMLTFHLDKENQLLSITYRQIWDTVDGSYFNGEPYILTEYKFHDTTEAQCQKEIDQYYKQATSGS